MSALDEGQLADLEVAARAATPGPWRAADQTHAEWLGIQSEAFALGTVFDMKDATHVVTASPDVVLALVAEVRETRATLARVNEAADELDAWDGDASPVLGGCSPGGVVRWALRGDA